MTPRNSHQTPEQEVWKLDKHIPIAVIFTLLLQTGGVVWWARGVESRIEAATAANARQDQEIAATEASLSSQEVVSATATAELRAVRESLSEVKAAIADQNVLLRQILQNGKANP